MNSELQLITIPANPPQPPMSQFKISRNLKVRGTAIYIIFAGVIMAIPVFLVLIDYSLVLAVLFSGVPTAIAIMFYFRFVRNKPRYYFDYYTDGLFDNVLHKKRNANQKAVRYVCLERR